MFILVAAKTQRASTLEKLTKAYPTRRKEEDEGGKERKKEEDEVSRTDEKCDASNPKLELG